MPSFLLDRNQPGKKEERLGTGSEAVGDAGDMERLPSLAPGLLPAWQLVGKQCYHYFPNGSRREPDLLLSHEGISQRAKAEGEAKIRGEGPCEMNS